MPMSQVTATAWDQLSLILSNLHESPEFYWWLIKMLCWNVCKTLESVKLAWLWVCRCQACCGLCHQTWRPGIILQVLCHHYPRRDQTRISWPGLETGEEEGGGMRGQGQETRRPVWAQSGQWAASVWGRASTYRGQGRQICVSRPRRPLIVHFKAEFLGLKQTALFWRWDTATFITIPVLKFEYSWLWEEDRSN